MSARRITANVITNYVRVVGQVVIALIMTPILVNSLGDQRYGLWSIVTAFTGYLLLLDLGVVSAVSKYTAQYGAKNDTAAIKRVIASAAMIVLPITLSLLMLSPWAGRIVISLIQADPTLQDTIEFVVMAATLEVAVLVFTGIFRGILFGRQKHYVVALLSLGMLIGKAIGLWYVLNQGFGLKAMASVTLSMTFIYGCGLFIVARITLPSVGVDPRLADRPMVGQVARFGRATFVSMLAAQIVYYSDAFVVGHFLSAAAFAYYTVAWSLVEYVNRFMVAASTVFVPVFSSAAESNKANKVTDLYVKAIRYQLTLSNLLCIGALVLGDAFLSVWINPEFGVVSTPILYALMVSQLFRGPQLLSYALLQGLGKHESYARIDFAFALVNLAGSIVLVQFLGLIGVALATAAVQSIFYGLIVPVLVTRATNWNIKSLYAQAYLPCVIPALVLASILLLLERLYPPSTFSAIFMQALCASIVYLLMAWRFTLGAPERDAIAHQVLQRLRWAKMT